MLHQGGDGRVEAALQLMNANTQSVGIVLHPATLCSATFFPITHSCSRPAAALYFVDTNTIGYSQSPGRCFGGVGITPCKLCSWYENVNRRSFLQKKTPTRTGVGGGAGAASRQPGPSPRTESSGGSPAAPAAAGSSASRLSVKWYSAQAGPPGVAAAAAGGSSGSDPTGRGQHVGGGGRWDGGGSGCQGCGSTRVSSSAGGGSFCCVASCLGLRTTHTLQLAYSPRNAY